MSNYAFSPQRRMNAQPFNNWAQNLSPIDRNVFDANPTEGFEHWLTYLNPSQINDNMLRRLYSRLYSGYTARQIADPQGNQYPELSFMDYLSRRDPNKEVARFSPAARSAEHRQFTRPARWVAF